MCQSHSGFLDPGNWNSSEHPKYSAHAPVRCRATYRMNLPLTHTSIPFDLIVQFKTVIRQKLVAARNIMMGQFQSSNIQNNSNVCVAPAAIASPVKLSNVLALGAGCYWGTEKYVRKNFQDKFPGSIKSCTVGFMSPLDAPKFRNPTYQQVCTGASGHIEVLQVELNEPEKHFEELIRFFFQFHDPTTKNRQGNDSGFQYASWIFCGDDEQMKIANNVKSQLQTLVNEGSVNCYEKKEVSTQITRLSEFTKAQEDHQEYLAKNPNGYCNHRIRLKEWIESTKK